MTALATPTTRPAHRQARTAAEEIEALWAMTPAERVVAMWRSELTWHQLSKWTSRAPHEIPMLGGEFAWIAMRTPEWAEADDEPTPALGSTDSRNRVSTREPNNEPS